MRPTWLGIRSDERSAIDIAIDDPKPYVKPWHAKALSPQPGKQGGAEVARSRVTSE
jgi:hypothetical protein